MSSTNSNSSGPTAADLLIGAGVALDGVAVTLLWGVRWALLLLGLALIVAGALRARSE